MRTTLTLEDDVASRLRSELRRSGKGLKDLVNEYLRLAMNSKGGARQPKPFRVRVSDMGTLPGLNYDNTGELLEQVEGTAHR